ncbi:DUF6053 domain-containing protein [Lysobacter enzymogenes]|uniref:DUF6053 domain-containing protein n=1 Tax=Lysobacter enzymogenes TaxID=69 RepID=UPI003D18F6A5
MRAGGDFRPIRKSTGSGGGRAFRPDALFRFAAIGSEGIGPEGPPTTADPGGVSFRAVRP